MSPVFVTDGLHPSPFVCALSPISESIVELQSLLNMHSLLGQGGEKGVREIKIEAIVRKGKRKRSKLSRSRRVDERDFQYDFQGPN